MFVVFSSNNLSEKSPSWNFPSDPNSDRAFWGDGPANQPSACIDIVRLSDFRPPRRVRDRGLLCWMSFLYFLDGVLWKNGLHVWCRISCYVADSEDIMGHRAWVDASLKFMHSMGLWCRTPKVDNLQRSCYFHFFRGLLSKLPTFLFFGSHMSWTNRYLRQLQGPKAPPSNSALCSCCHYLFLAGAGDLITSAEYSAERT